MALVYVLVDWPTLWVIVLLAKILKCYRIWSLLWIWLNFVIECRNTREFNDEPKFIHEYLISKGVQA